MTATMYLNTPALSLDEMANTCTATTPEILNNLMSLHGPSFPVPGYQYPDGQDSGCLMPGPAAPCSGSDCNMGPSYYGPPLASSPPMGSCSLPASTMTTMSPLESVQATRHHLVKESIKFTIQSRRQASGLQSLHEDNLLSSCKEEVGWPCSSSSDSFTYSGCLLTPEDEERRRRRRERNKVAATKCRNKKKEKTQILVQESENLEATNVSLKDEIQKLEAELNRLQDLLTHHLPVCHLNSANYCNYMQNNSSCSAL